MTNIRERLSYANIVSTLALTMTLGAGTAYAANTIGSSDIIDESILSADIKDGAVSAAEIPVSELTGAHLADGSVALADIAGVEVLAVLDSKAAPLGGCRPAKVAVGGAVVGQAVSVTPLGKVRNGVVLTSPRVAKAGLVTLSVCALGRKPMKPIRDLQLRVITFA